MSVTHRFPAGFVWGSATSAHQVEGGNRLNDWWRFESEPGRIANGDVSGAACKHYELFDQDFALAAADHHRAHRLSIEWSRIEPEPGRIDVREVAHYHEVFASMRKHRLQPLVTLHHFTNPLWIADRGGWENRETVDRFVAFARFCGREFGGDVDWWCTVNEPEVYAFRSFSEGVWPPCRKDDSAALMVIANLLEAHGLAYRALHEADRIDADGDGYAARVGFAKHYAVLEPSRPWFPLDLIRTFFESRVFNDDVLRAPRTGEIDLSIPGARPVKRRIPELEASLDYVGLNYYARWKVKMFAPDVHVATEGAPVNDLGWELYPRGVEEALLRLTDLGVPILITENGVADATDRMRPRVMVDTLVHVAQAIQRGAPVLGYYHWSLMDNFEWADGYRGRFGLYHVDFSDPARPRTRRRSADLYARIARLNAVDADLRRDAATLDPLADVG
jgi:beta-glucosidase